MTVAILNLIHTTPRKTPNTELHRWLEYRNQQYNIERMNNNSNEYEKGLNTCIKIINDIHKDYKETIEGVQSEYFKSNAKLISSVSNFIVGLREVTK